MSGAGDCRNCGHSTSWHTDRADEGCPWPCLCGLTRSALSAAAGDQSGDQVADEEEDDGPTLDCIEFHRHDSLCYGIDNWRAEL